MSYVELLGFVAGSLGIAASVPQLVKSLRTGSTEDLHVGSSLLRVSSAGCWIAYGTISDQLPLIVTSGCVLGLEFLLTYVTLRSSRAEYKKVELELKETP